MLTRNRLKFYTSLHHKKYRELHCNFLAEGEKIALDILGFTQSNIKIISLLANHDFLKQTDLKNLSATIEVIEVSDQELKQISSLSTPNRAILVCSRTETVPDYEKIYGELSLYLEDIRDPGNLGTIIRTADWFGINHIFCSRDSVDVFNPKVIQSSMGAIAKVQVYYEDPEVVITNLKNKSGYKVFGTMLNGRNVFQETLSEKGLIVFGNESRGISPGLVRKIDIKLTIPPFGEHLEGSESLNIASAASIVIAEFRGKTYSK